jgi:phosphohistidine phosphatase SixA
VQTAAILAAAYDGLDPVVVPVLAPAQSADDVTRWLIGERRHDTVAIVGHEPGLGRAASWLLAKSERSFIEIKKGAALLLSCPDAVDAAAATLLWALTPGQLRGLE